MSIEQSPQVVDERARFGDWEADLLLGKDHQGAVVTLTECRSRFTLLRCVESKHSNQVAQAVIGLLTWVTHLESVTSDNGKELAAHRKVSQALFINFYFAYPYASWERGTNENTNELIRQYLPKERSLKNVSSQEETMIMDRLNLRPRKCLDFRSPFDVFFGHNSVALAS